MATTTAAGSANNQVSATPELPAMPATEKPTATAPPQRRTQTSRPEYRYELMLKSIQAQRVFERSYQTIAYSLFSIEVILRIVGDKPETVSAALTLVDKRIETMSEQLNKAASAMRAKAQASGLNVNPTYSQPVKVVAAISTPQAGKVVQMVRQLDDMMSIMDMLWLNSELSGEERITDQYRWERRFYSLASFLYNLQTQAHEEAKRRGKDQEVHEEVPQLAAEQTATEVTEVRLAAKDKDGADLIPTITKTAEFSEQGI